MAQPMHEYHLTTVIHLTGGYPQSRYWTIVNTVGEMLAAALEDEPLDEKLPLPPKMSFVIDMQKGVRIQKQNAEEG